MRISFAPFKIAAVCLPLALGACGTTWFADPLTNPVIEDTLGIFNGGPIATLATTPGRRIVLVNVDKETEDNSRYGDFCAEPPADVAESVAESFQAAVKLQAKIADKGEGTAAAELGKSLATAVQLLGQRSQGIMLYRDTGYRLCEYYLNRKMEDEDYLEELTALRKEAASLIRLELLLTNGRIGAQSLPSKDAPKLQDLQSLLQKMEREGVEEQLAEDDSSNAASQDESGRLSTPFVRLGTFQITESLIEEQARAGAEKRREELKGIEGLIPEGAKTLAWKPEEKAWVADVGPFSDPATANAFCENEKLKGLSGFDKERDCKVKEE